METSPQLQPLHPAPPVDGSGTKEAVLVTCSFCDMASVAHFQGIVFRKAGEEQPGTEQPPGSCCVGRDVDRTKRAAPVRGFEQKRSPQETG